jgi:hypothetical protein
VITFTLFEYLLVILSQPRSLISRYCKLTDVGGSLRNWYNLPFAHHKNVESIVNELNPEAPKSIPVAKLVAIIYFCPAW